MGDWDFLYEMKDRGYSERDIADAAGCGYAPWQEPHDYWIDSEFEDESEDGVSIEPDKPFQSREGYPYSVLEQTRIWEDLVECAECHFENTGRYLQIWGELGEIYAEIKFGLRRHASCTEGSDGTIKGKRVEVKTISPEKTGKWVHVKSQGNFEQLLVVRIDRDFQFTGRIIERSELKRAGVKFLRGNL